MDMNTLITNPRAHRAQWINKNPQALVQNGGLLSLKDLERWACDICMAPLDPDKPIHALDDLSLCGKCLAKCAPQGTDFADCQCTGCSPKKL